MHAHRYPVVLLGSLTLVLVLVLPGVLLPMPSVGAPLVQGTLTPTAFVYIPYVAKQYPMPTATPTATPTNTPTPEPGAPVDGHWTGTTSFDLPVSFDVSGGGTVLSNWKIEFRGACLSPGGVCSFRLELFSPGPMAITNNQWSYSPGEYSFFGEFTSPTTASGNYVVDHRYVSGCRCYFSQSGTWAATPEEAERD